ncbi:hypothetical protein DPMN_044835 [Dreissena polymorpha]|uniref:Uncharacterized protein n=1 Tax=Dreissena polymorpha TaxID=45954 RepID=A0A9D4D4V9_DREPO|nr:hypothetical protein DPMN_044835 [Dreissena polymorpha]
MKAEDIRIWLIEQVSPIIQVTQSTRNALNGTYMQEDNADSVNNYGNIVIELGLS